MNRNTITYIILFVSISLILLLSRANDEYIRSGTCFLLGVILAAIFFSVSEQTNSNRIQVINEQDIYFIEEQYEEDIEIPDEKYIPLCKRQSDTLYWNVQKDCVVSEINSRFYPVYRYCFARQIQEKEVGEKYIKIERGNGEYIYWDTQDQALCVNIPM